MNCEKEVEATQSSGNIANAVLATVLSPLKEKERNKRFLRLLQKLLNDKDYEAIGLLRTMVENDTLAMQKSYEIMTEYLVRSNGG